MADPQPGVLVVDDDASVLTFQSRAFSRVGWAVSAARDLDEAVRVVRAESPELVVCDYQLEAGTTGVQVLEALRAAGHDLPCILVTGFADESRILEALRAGFRDVITKRPGYEEALTAAAGRVVYHERARRARIEAARAHAREERFRVLADAMPQLVWTARADGTVDYYNRRHLEFQGFRRHASEWDWAPGLHPDDLPATRAAWEHAIQTGETYEIEHRVRRADGSYRWYVSRAVPQRDEHGRVVAWYGTATDIDRLKQTTAILQTVADSTPDLIYVKDRAGRLIFANRMMLERIGNPAEQVLGRTDAEWHGGPPEEAAALMAADERVVQTGVPGLVEERVTGPAGTRVYLSRKSPLRNQAGDVIGVVGISSDITERAIAEEERKVLLARERAARAEAERLSRVKDEFLATLSHELRTPLNAILGWAQLLVMRPETDSARLHRVLETISRNARLQVRLIEDLLDMSRIVSGNMHLERTTVDLRKAVAAAVESVLPSAEGKGVVVRLELPDQPAFVRGDAARLQQVVWNLLTNAVKFTDGGGEVRVTASRTAGDIVLAVQDTGRGIAPEFLPQVFERFWQADSSTTREHGGLGLGLAIARHIVELLGGRITAVSEGPGAGATFTVRLPAVETAGRPAPPPAEPARGLPSIEGLRVLVIEDDQDARELAEQILRDRGAQVVLEPSASKALQRLEAEPFDVLLADLAMPGRDGFELLRGVRQLSDPARRDVPVIALTAFARAEDRARTEAAGFAAHVSKPVDPADLTRAIAQAVPAERGSGPAAERDGQRLRGAGTSPPGTAPRTDQAR